MNSHLLAGDAGSITRVAGIEVGHFTETRRPTGCTAILARDGAVAGVDVRGAAPGTRETDLLHPSNLVDQVHAIVLAGGSAWGLDAATGVVRWLEERGVGFDAVPMPPFMARCMPKILPTAAPVPAPTLPSAGSAVVAAAQAA